MNKTIKVLHYVGVLGSGGIESYVMNLYRNIDRSKVQFDFLVTRNQEEFYENEIISLGGQKICINEKNITNKVIKNLIGIFKFYRTIKINKYNIIHFHVSSPLSCFKAPLIARIANVENIILHSHSSLNNGSRTKLFLYKILAIFTMLMGNYYFACSSSAGEFVFGKKFTKNQNSRIQKNGIDINKYIFNKSKRQDLRKIMKLENNFVVGHVGRFTYQKNHSFIIKTFNEIIKINSNSMLLLVGEGEFKDLIEKEIKKYGLEKYVILYGLSNKVEELLQVMDVFIFPSHSEGLGIVAIEAQASALITICSEFIPSEAKITDFLKYMKLNTTSKKWAEKILSYQNGYKRYNTSEEIINAGYDISTISKEFESFYLGL